VEITHQISSAGEGVKLTPELSVVARANLLGDLVIVTQQTRNELVSAHPDQAMNGVHRRPLAGIREGPRPGEDVKIVAIDECSVNIE
jgi:hypothetical protein